MSFKRKLREITDWLLLAPAGETLMLLALIGFCLAIAGVALIIGYRSEDYSRYQDKPKKEKAEKWGFHAQTIEDEIWPRKKTVKNTVKKSTPGLNRTNDNIEWAKWSWNPVSGCLGPDR